VAVGKGSEGERLGTYRRGCRQARHSNCRATVLYDRPSGPVKDHHTDQMIEEAARNGVRLAQVRGKPGLHGKFIAWDDDDLLVTSLNWGSAVGDADFPYGEVGIHIKASGIADLAIAPFARNVSRPVQGLRGAPLKTGRTFSSHNRRRCRQAQLRDDSH